MRRRARQAVKRALPIFGAIAFAYGAYPYVTLYRLGYAIRHGDSTALETLVDWDGVREGLKEDVCDAMAEEPADPAEATALPARDDAALPAFGSGFMRGIAGNVIDNNVTPAAIVAAAQADDRLAPSVRRSQDQPQIAWAFFDSPTEFSVQLRPPGEHAKPIRVRMEMRHGEWKVTRAWLPRELLMRANERT
ncbi:MAG TPA: DUF2939 domain-containing protein [Acidisphaera sp.]|nr:DUF2939 domain-containing protein [Acidisphaera sp.]